MEHVSVEQKAACDKLQNCPMNAHCNDESSKCVCDPEYFPSEGICQAQGDFGSECSSTEACVDSKRLSCLNRSCHCNSSTESMYDNSNEMCVIKAGKALNPSNITHFTLPLCGKCLLFEARGHA